MFRIFGYSLFLVVLYLGNLHSQVYQVSIENTALVNQSTFEFDIFIKSQSGTFQLTSYQCALTYNPKIKNGGSLSFAYIAGSSGLNNIPSLSNGIYFDSTVSNFTFASLPGSDNITTTKKKIGRFRLQNTNTFGPYLPKITNLNWDFNGIVATILTGTGFTNITNPVNHISQVNGLEKLTIATAFSSDTTSSNNHPGKTMDGLGFFDTDPQSYWSADPGSQYIIYDLGIIRAVSITRFSFYNFSSGRKYIYSIQLSSNNLNWTTVISNDTSEAIEYTENEFMIQNARYVKLVLHSNNQSASSTIWEAELWGNNDALLPVELSAFNLSIIDGNIMLKWETTSEVSNYGFEIQRSTDNSNWNVIGFAEGHGNSNISHQYEFLDKDKLSGKYYYRLKQIDTDGSFEYSNTLDVDINNVINDFSLSQNYPNPFNPTTKIKFSLPLECKVKLVVLNILGELVEEVINGEMPEGEHEITFNGSNLASGVYIYKLEIEKQFTDYKKMILAK